MANHLHVKIAADSTDHHTSLAIVQIEYQHAMLSIAGVDTDQLQRNVGMREPAYTTADIEEARVTGGIQRIIEELDEYNRRLGYARRRYAMNGKFDLE